MMLRIRRLRSAAGGAKLGLWIRFALISKAMRASSLPSIGARPRSSSPIRTRGWFSSRRWVARTSLSEVAFLTRTSRSTSALADPTPLPWLYSYREDPQSLRLGEPLYRPFVPVALANGDQMTAELMGLIDTGADSVLASDVLAEQLEIDLDDHEGETTIGVGGRVAKSGMPSTSASAPSRSRERSTSGDAPLEVRGENRVSAVSRSVRLPGREDAAGTAPVPGGGCDSDAARSRRSATLPGYFVCSQI